MKEYKIAKGWGIIIYICAPLLIALFIFLLAMPFIPATKNDIAPDAYWFMAVLSIVMITVFTFALLDIIKGKFVIDRNRVYSVTTLSNRELLFHEIKGYRTNDKFIIIEPKSKNKKNIKISTYFGKTDEIEEWLLENDYPDLDKIQEIEEKKEILKNQEFGWNETEREQKLVQARKTAKIINGIGAIAGIWLLFFPKPYQYAIVPCIVFPIICLFILRNFRGLIRIGEKKNTAYPNIFMGLFASILALCLRSLLDFQILDYSNLWVPMIIIAIIYITILLFCVSDIKYEKAYDYLNAFGIVLLALSYAYGSYTTVNCVYDNSKPELFNAVVLEKGINSGKNKTYYLNLTPWGPRKESERVTVNQSFYENTQVNDEVNVYLMKGKFEIPWFQVTAK
ncbi:hypothetical protein RB619_04175 [Flavobacterium sp. LHD-80]|uniref:hypothetical protein n=1 Tax=Flavobacterium sp. LHD-80 TaxID=3071411 RepID=UPI0027E0C638|nr:hypothetical protein [Flavobacterium sp. LHD-80]MDQ6469831.1 hypothetical protein [Flavobacterium sp. LHD-80]